MKKYVLCGASSRGFDTYGKGLVGPYADVADLVGIFDINVLRATYVRDSLDPEKAIPVFTDYDEMIRQTSPNVSIITTMDSLHHEYIVRSLDAGVDVICEKPMTIDAEKTWAIMEAEKRNNRKIIVTFNARFEPVRKRIKELLDGGAVGRLLSVDFEWLLDQRHGADYFRRWHKFLKNSGGLLITKATHHFDLINWWIGQEPIKVYANGELSFYGPTREARSERCTGCRHRKTCEFLWKVDDDEIEKVQKMYMKPEVTDGYVRDQCVFAPCDIYDNMSLSVRYTDGILMTYSLNAYMPYEGYRVAINGTKGRLQTQQFTSGPDAEVSRDIISLYYPNGEKIDHIVPKLDGVHGGSDAILLEGLFRERPTNPLGLFAGSRDGALSLLIGAAANISIQTGEPVLIKDLLDI